MGNELHTCDHSSMGRDAVPGCIVVYNGDKCPLCALQDSMLQNEKLAKQGKLCFTRQPNGSYDIFMDVSVEEEGVRSLYAARPIQFEAIEPYAQDDGHRLLNIPSGALKEFALAVLKEESK